MSCKHLKSDHKTCSIKNKEVYELDCRNCMLKIEKVDDYFTNITNPFGDIFNNIFNKK